MIQNMVIRQKKGREVEILAAVVRKARALETLVLGVEVPVGAVLGLVGRFFCCCVLV